MGNKTKDQPLTAPELSARTGIPLQEVEVLMTRVFSVQEISEMTGVPVEEIEKRAQAENWPYVVE